MYISLESFQVWGTLISRSRRPQLEAEWSTNECLAGVAKLRAAAGLHHSVVCRSAVARAPPGVQWSGPGVLCWGALLELTGV